MTDVLCYSVSSLKKTIKFLFTHFYPVRTLDFKSLELDCLPAVAVRLLGWKRSGWCETGMCHHFIDMTHQFFCLQEEPL